MSDMVRWITEHFGEVPPTPALVIDATKHMRKNERRQLFSEDLPSMKTAEGRWFEGVIYERMLKLVQRTDLVGGIARKGADAPSVGQNAALGQNGLFYSNIGDIKIRGNGQDLAEFDLLLKDREGNIAFAEIVTSPTDMKEFEAEIRFKKRLIGFIYGQAHVPFLLYSSVDVSRHPIVKRIMKEPDNGLIVTGPCEELKRLIEGHTVRHHTRKSPKNPKFFRADEIEARRPFDFKSLHEERRQRLLQMIGAKAKKEEFAEPDDLPPIVRKILCGGLYPSAARALCASYPLTVRGKPILCAEVPKRFSKIVLAVNLPDGEPIIYLRSRHRKEYLKMIRDKQGGFKFESARTPHMAGFFLWLETISPTLGSQIAHEILMTFIGPGRNSAPFVPATPQQGRKSEPGPGKETGKKTNQGSRRRSRTKKAPDEGPEKPAVPLGAAPAPKSAPRRRRRRPAHRPVESPEPAGPGSTSSPQAP
ncbi:hypothetical protein DSECCO2_523950 [anaerobic digester metagenome]